MEADKYFWSFDESSELWSNSADSIEACIYQAKEDADGEDVVCIGENIPFVPRVSAESVLDELQEQAADFGGEAGEDWDACDCKTMHRELDELSEELTAVVVAWLKKYSIPENFV